MKSILVITTGGTIVSSDSGKGLQPLNNNLLENVFDKYEFNIVFYPIFNIDSSDMDINKWKKLGLLIDKNHKSYDGIIVTHGTDTLAYTAAALSIMLENIAIPVVLTGSQLPLEDENTDAINNIDLAVRVATSKLKGVFVAFNNKIINGFCATKLHSAELDAFESVNYPYVNIDTVIERNEKYKFDCSFSNEVFLLKLAPIVDSNVINLIVKLGYKGILIEGYGLGGISETFIKPIKNAVQKGVKVWVTSQCLFDGTDYSVYKVGKDIIDAGACDCKKMTVEYAIAKLSNVIEQGIN